MLWLLSENLPKLSTVVPKVDDEVQSSNTQNVVLNVG